MVEQYYFPLLSPGALNYYSYIYIRARGGVSNPALGGKIMFYQPPLLPPPPHRIRILLVRKVKRHIKLKHES